MSDTLPYNQTQSPYSGPIGVDNNPNNLNQYPNGQQVYPQGGYGAPMQGQRPQNPLANYQFSSDELRILRECNTESFFQRCIPLSTMFGLGTHFAVKNGILSPNPKFGSVPKVVVSVIVGYFLGKVSYQRKCAEKMMQLPNSKLGEILRQRKQGNIVGPLTPNQGLGTPGFGFAPFSPRSDEVYEEGNLKASSAQTSALELDTERPSFGLDDSQSFGDLNNQTDLLPLEPPKKTVTYEELRKANRDNYYKKMQSGNVPILQDQPTIIRVKETSGTSNKTDELQTEQMKSAPKNQYGDVWSQ